jgi:hypothetical protein
MPTGPAGYTRSPYKRTTVPPPAPPGDAEAPTPMPEPPAAASCAEPRGDNALANARTGYQAAVSLWVGEGLQLWARFSSMLAVNAGLLAAMAWARTLPWMLAYLAVFGMVLCALWLLMMWRGYAYQSYLVASARELEEAYLEPVCTITRGHDFVNHQEVRFPFGTHHLPELLRVRDRYAVYAVIGMLLVFYLGVLIVSAFFRDLLRAA